MRTLAGLAILIVLACLLPVGCGESATPESPPPAADGDIDGPPAAESPPPLGPKEARCRILGPEDPVVRTGTKRWGWELVAAEIETGGPGSVDLVFGDRMPAPLEDGTFRAKHIMNSSVAGPGTIRIEFSYRFIPGKEVLEQYLKPMGGEDATEAVRLAVPGIDNARLGRFRLLNENPNGASWVEGPIETGMLPPPQGSALTNSPAAGTTLSLPAGEAVTLWQKGWFNTADIGSLALESPYRFRAMVDGKPMAIEDYPLPLWTLHVRFTPTK